MIFKFDDLSKQSKIGYNALYNVVFGSISHGEKIKVNSFTVPLCLNSENKVLLTEKNFIFFESVLSELSIYGDYTITKNNGRAVEEVKTDYSTVTIFWTESENALKDFSKDVTFEHFNFSDIDTSKLLKRDGKAEKAKTAENNAKKEKEEKTLAEAKEIVESAKNSTSENNEVANSDKTLAQSAKKLNDEIDADNAEIFKKTINSYADMIGKLFGDDSNKNKLVEMLTNFATIILQ